MTYVRMKEENMFKVNASDIGRLSTFHAGINMVKQHPLTGVGFNLSGSEKIYQQYKNIKYPRLHPVTAIHNMYMVVLAEQGVFGFIFQQIFLWGVLCQLWWHMNIKRKSGISIQYETMFSAMLIVLMLHGLMMPKIEDGYFWVILAMSVVVLKHKNSLTVSESSND